MFFDTLVSKLPVNAQPYAKAWAAFFALSVAAASDLVLTGPELRQLVAEAGAVLVALIVRQVPNQ